MMVTNAPDVPTDHGYRCKRCDGPAPMGVGYLADGPAAAKASAPLTVCECGFSRTYVGVMPEAEVRAFVEELVGGDAARELTARWLADREEASASARLDRGPDGTWSVDG